MELNQREQDKSSNNNINNTNNHDTEDVELWGNQQELTRILKKSNHQARSQHRVSIIDHQERSGRGRQGREGGGRSGTGTRGVEQRTNKHKGGNGNGMLKS